MHTMFSRGVKHELLDWHSDDLFNAKKIITFLMLKKWKIGILMKTRNQTYSYQNHSCVCDLNPFNTIDINSLHCKSLHWHKPAGCELFPYDNINSKE